MIQLVCLPHAGGAASAFRDWPELLPEVDVEAVELPGRGRLINHSPFQRLPPLVAWLADGGAPLRPPFALFGHSMGAIVAFTLTRHLRARGAALPVHLLVSGCAAPPLLPVTAPTSDMSTAEFVERLRTLNGTPPEVFAYPELLEALLPALNADFTLFDHYVHRPEPPLGCPITAFGGSDDPEAGPTELAAWRDQTSAEFRLEIFPGDHFFLQSRTESFLPAVSRALARTPSASASRHDAGRTRPVS